MDGKPILTSKKIYFYVVTALGDIAAVAIDRDGKRRLFMNGKAIAGTDHAYHVVFSPDGKRWAAACAELDEIAVGNTPGDQAGIHANGAWVVVDGKKGLQYAKVSDLAFTPDSSRSVYVAEAPSTGGPGRKFVVLNGEEDNGHMNLRVKPTFSKTGNRVFYVGEAMGGKIQGYLDGKPLPPNAPGRQPDAQPGRFTPRELRVRRPARLDAVGQRRAGQQRRRQWRADPVQRGQQTRRHNCVASQRGW